MKEEFILLLDIICVGTDVALQFVTIWGELWGERSELWGERSELPSPLSSDQSLTLADPRKGIAHSPG
jgi:hypothetical protein